MVADLYTGKGSLSVAPQVAGAVEVGGVSYFSAADPQQGYELWRSDGTADGTYRVTDICPGACDSGAFALGQFHGRIYLLADDGEHGMALWSTDGAPGHEERVEGVCDAACVTGLQGAQTWRGSFWFLEPGPRNTQVLWTSDLTAPGTHAVANLCGELGVCAPATSDEVSLGGPDPSGQGLLLWVDGGAGAASPASNELLRTDGTPQGTVVLHRFQGTSQSLLTPNPAAGAPLFFTDGSDLWSSDGTLAGTHLVRSLDGLLSTDFPEVYSQEYVDGVWYAVFYSGEWLRATGAVDGTAVLANFGEPFEVLLVHQGSAALALADDGVWRAGTTAATTRNIFAWQVEGVLTAVEQPQRVFVMLWYSDGIRIWTTDGTADGTFHVVLPPAEPVDQYEMGGLAGGVLISRGGEQAWAVDATATQVVALHDFQPANGPSLSLMESGAVLGGRLLFYAQSASTTGSLYSSDGTAAGTAILTRAADDPYYIPDFNIFTHFGGDKVLFNTNATGIWIGDGTARGTRPLFGPAQILAPRLFTPVAALGQDLIFAGHTLVGLGCDPGEIEPWITDGVRADTHEMKDLNPYYFDGDGGSQCEGVPLSSNPGPGLALGPIVLFAADDLVHGRELFASDGTAEGTRLVADINPGTAPNTITDPLGVPPNVGLGSQPRDLVALGSRALFVADDGSSGSQLWITDGTWRGTRRVTRLQAGQDGSSPHDLVAWRGAIYFIARLGDGEGLWRSDGTAAGTVLVSDLVLAGSATRATRLTAAEHRLFFAGFNEATGTELWTSAGTAGTTGLVTDLRPGVRGAMPQGFAVVRDVLLFAADDGVAGMELWRSDGTAAGTYRLSDIAPGAASSNPGPFWVVGDQVLFGADDGDHGRELWALPISALTGGADTPH
jgi:ELWxxDGT repeat protein